MPSIRATQLRVALSMVNVTAAVTTDLGDPLGAAGSVHSRRKQQIASRLVAGAAFTMWGAEGSKEGPIYGPIYQSASVTTTGGGNTLSADISFQPNSCVNALQMIYNINFTSTCPVGYSPTAPTLNQCVWFSIRGLATGWHNATNVDIINSTAIRLSVPDINDTAIATSFGQNSFPVTVLFSGSLPVVPWSEAIL